MLKFLNMIGLYIQISEELTARLIILNNFTTVVKLLFFAKRSQLEGAFLC